MQTNNVESPRYEIFVFNVKDKPGLEAYMYTRNYPTYHDMMSICLNYGITNVSDFMDIDNCMDNEVRVVYGYATNNYSPAKKFEYQITKLSDIPTTYEELILKSGV